MSIIWRKKKDISDPINILPLEGKNIKHLSNQYNYIIKHVSVIFFQKKKNVNYNNTCKGKMNTNFSNDIQYEM